MHFLNLIRAYPKSAVNTELCNRQYAHPELYTDIITDITFTNVNNDFSDRLKSKDHRFYT
jgi:hypothetical protein